MRRRRRPSLPGPAGPSRTISRGSRNGRGGHRPAGSPATSIRSRSSTCSDSRPARGNTSPMTGEWTASTRWPTPCRSLRRAPKAICGWLSRSLPKPSSRRQRTVASIPPRHFKANSRRDTSLNCPMAGWCRSTPISTPGRFVASIHGCLVCTSSNCTSTAIRPTSLCPSRSTPARAAIRRCSRS